jgi:stage V sporulation protein R
VNGVRIKTSLPSALKYHAVVIENAARDAGLDFFDVVFELLDARAVNGIAAYGGFPVRYPSWRFGMDFERLQKGYDWGLSKIYELVINNDPTYAYLVAGNSLLEQKLVMAHVFGHADFFKHNVWFQPTDRSMLDTMADHAQRVRRHVDEQGQEAVERVMDRLLSLEGLIDPYLPGRRAGRPNRTESRVGALSERSRRALETLCEAPGGWGPPEEPAERMPRDDSDPPTYDVLGFLERRAPLEPWVRDLLRIVRDEAYYFAPQRTTKIANEGWASFWHSRILTSGVLEASEVIDFADVHSGATAAAPGQLNPYRLGIELYRHAEDRGLDLFTLRRAHNDVSLIDALVDEEFALRHHRIPAAQRREAIEAGFDWQAWKTQLLAELAWGGQPRIELMRVEGPQEELVLVHHHDGRDLQVAQAGAVLQNLQALWKGPVRLHTRVGDKSVALHADGERVETREEAGPDDEA